MYVPCCQTKKEDCYQTVQQKRERNAITINTKHVCDGKIEKIVYVVLKKSKYHDDVPNPLSVYSNIVVQKLENRSY